MQIFVFGINHKSAPLSIRERFALREERIPDFLFQALRLPHVEELVALSTCNRMELYGTSRHANGVRQQLAPFLEEFHQNEASMFQNHSYFYQGEAAVRHGFLVASSLNSMIVGEPQILGQMKGAYRLALEAGTTGRLLNKFFHRAFNVAKKVRTETAVASHPVSVSYAAVVLAKQIFGDLSEKKALILGAGKMSELAIKHLRNSGIQTFYVANRTEERAKELARKFGGEPIPFSKFEKWLGDADVVLTSTQSAGYLINGKMVQEAFRHRKNNPMFFIDLAVPRDVSPEVNHLPNVFLYDVDDLGAVVEVNKEERMREAQRAELLVEKEVVQFAKVLRTFEVFPTISSLSKKFEKICQKELDKAFQKLPQLDADGREVVENLASSIVKKVLHDPMVTLKEQVPQSDPVDYSALVRKLFRLDEV